MLKLIVPDSPDIIECKDFSKLNFRARDLLIKRWNEYKDFEHGAVNCPLWLAHPWDPKVVKLNSAFKFDRHVCAPTGTHSPGAGKGAVIKLYTQWCEDRNRRYICRL